MVLSGIALALLVRARRRGYEIPTPFKVVDLRRVLLVFNLAMPPLLLLFFLSVKYFGYYWT